MIFCRKTAEKKKKKKNLFHFQFPSPRFPHGCDVGPSFRNAQVTHAGTPRGGAQEFLARWEGRGGRAAARLLSCDPCGPSSALYSTAWRRYVTRKVPEWKSPASRGGKTERKKRELAVYGLCGGPSAERSEHAGAERQKQPPEHSSSGRGGRDPHPRLSQPVSDPRARASMGSRLLLALTPTTACGVRLP